MCRKRSSCRKFGKEGEKAVKEKIGHFFGQFGLSVLLLALCAYLILQLALGVGDTLDVTHTTYDTAQDTVQLEAFLFRDETPLYSGTPGTNCYLAENGEHVAVGSTVATTYTASGDASLQKRISQIDRTIRILEQSNLSAGALTTDLPILDQQIEKMTVELLREVADDALDKALRGEEALWVQLNRRQAIASVGVSENGAYSGRINLLLQEKDDLQRSLHEDSLPVTTDASGYFYNAVDGYEDRFTMKALDELTLEGFDKLADERPNQKILANACGKLADASRWCIAVRMGKRDAGAYADGKSYRVLFPYSGGTELPMLLERKILQTDRDDAVLIFSSRLLPEGFDFTRRQTVQLVRADYAGIRVDADALRMLDGELGCYVLDGTRVIFKKAEVLYRNEEFAICEVPYNSVRDNREDKAFISDEYLSLYDAVILSGRNLYVGKIIQ